MSSGLRFDPRVSTGIGTSEIESLKINSVLFLCRLRQNRRLCFLWRGRVSQIRFEAVGPSGRVDITRQILFRVRTSKRSNNIFSDRGYWIFEMFLNSKWRNEYKIIQLLVDEKKIVIRSRRMCRRLKRFIISKKMNRSQIDYLWFRSSKKASQKLEKNITGYWEKIIVFTFTVETSKI